MNYKFEFSKEKDLWLREYRKLSSNDAIALLNRGDIIDVINTPDQKKHPNQILYVLDIGGYCNLMPCDIDKENQNKKTLKTIYKSRKMHKLYEHKFTKK